MIDTPQAQETLAELAESTAAALLAFAQAVRPASDRDGADLASLGLAPERLHTRLMAPEAAAVLSCTLLAFRAARHPEPGQLDSAAHAHADHPHDPGPRRQPDPTDRRRLRSYRNAPGSQVPHDLRLQRPAPRHAERADGNLQHHDRGARCIHEHAGLPSRTSWYELRRLRSR